MTLMTEWSGPHSERVGREVFSFYVKSAQGVSHSLAIIACMMQTLLIWSHYIQHTQTVIITLRKCRTVWTNTWILQSRSHVMCHIPVPLALLSSHLVISLFLQIGCIADLSVQDFQDFRHTEFQALLTVGVHLHTLDNTREAPNKSAYVYKESSNTVV